MKDKRMSIRISETELQRIHSKANKARMSFTEYVTKACLGKQIFVINGLDEVIRQQKAIGRNQNQLTTLCNMGKVNMANLSELTDEMQKQMLFSLMFLKKRGGENSNSKIYCK